MNSLEIKTLDSEAKHYKKNKVLSNTHEMMLLSRILETLFLSPAIQ